MIIEDVDVSLIRFCSDFASLQGDLQFVNFDAHADESTLPPSDLIGLSGVTVSIENGFVNVKAMIGIVTLDDTNLFRLSALTAELFEELLPEKKVPIFNSQTGEEKGWLIVQDGTTLLPVSGSMARPMKYLLVHLLSSRAI